MGMNKGKKFSRKKVEAMLAHFGSRSALADFVGCHKSSVDRVLRGLTSHAPFRAKLEAAYQRMLLEQQQHEKNGKPGTLRALLHAAVEKVEEAPNVEERLARIEHKLDVLLHDLGVEA